MTEADEVPSVTLGQVTGIVLRGRWWILGATVAFACAAIAFAYHLPDSFTSEATLLVVRQQVPQRYVTPTSTLGIADELQAIQQQVLSRERLLALIDQFGLYSRERRRLAPEQLIELMRKNVTVEPLETAGNKDKSLDFNAIRISFSADRATVAQEVTSRLTSLLMREDLKSREDQATTTTNFLHERLEAAKSRLTEQEERLRDFKMQYLGELPEQQQSNLTILSGAQAQLQNARANIDRAQQQRVYMESLLSGYQRLAVRGVTPGPVSQGEVTRPADPLLALQSDLARLEASKAQLLSVYRERHPDVMAVDKEISAKQALLQNLRGARSAAAQTQAVGATSAAGGASSGTAQASALPESEEGAVVAQLKSQLESNRLEIENLQKDEQQQRAAVSLYQSRLNLTPVREQQLAGISRDYELSRQEYLDLLGKEQQSQLAMSLEKRQGGQQFRLSESPSLPTIPSSPKRIKIAGLGLGGGLVLGLVLAVLAEIRKPALYDEKDVSRKFAVPLIVGLPLLLTPGQARMRAWKRRIEWSGASVLMLGLFAAEYFVYRHP